MESPTLAHLRAVHSPSEVTITKKQSYGPGLLVFFYVTTSPAHPLPNQEHSRVAYFNRQMESIWDMKAS